MRLKILLMAVFVAGIGASYALADNGRHHGDHGCQEAHVKGTIAPQTLTVTSDGRGEHSTFPAGTAVVLTLGGTGQTVRVNVEACSTGTGTTTSLSVRSLELRVVNQQPTVTLGTTTTGEKHHGDDDHGDHHKGGTTTVATTTAATTTAATTTAATTTATTTTTP